MPPFHLPQGRLLVAVSGGRDSVALLHIVAMSGVDFAVAHCNFHLREGDSDSDEQFVRQLASQYGADCYVAQFNTNAYAAERHLSIEEAARNLRYEFFNTLCSKHGYDYILTAHHRDDSIETFFINLLRGTGIAGLHGIRYLNGRVCRPLLQWGRNDINSYISDNELHYVEDYTNATLLYRRNQVRHQLLPLLRQMEPNFDRSMQATMSHLADVEQVYLQSVDSLRHSILHTADGMLWLAIDDVAKLNPGKTLLYELLKPFGVNGAMVGDIVESLSSQSGKQFITATHTIIRDRDRLLVVQRVDDEEPEITTTELPIAAVTNFRATDKIAFFDADRVVMPISLRHWRHADRFCPYGMKGSKLLSDFFVDSKMSLVDKQRQWLLVDAADSILWVVGRRTDRRAAVTLQTARVLKVEIK